MSDDQNPLLEPQREKSGSETKSKYNYQYHWALYRAIEEHGKKSEYAVFVELHEDVVVSNSLDAKKASFEFNQVKTNAQRFTLRSLLKPKNGSSVLGKLIGSVNGKSFAKQVSDINLVSVSGFGITLNKPALRLQKITLKDIDATDLANLELAIKNELKISPLPPTLQFIIPNLPTNDFQKIIISEIANLVSKLHPGSRYDPVSIYRLLIDELNSKGEVIYDFARWSELLKNKALTSTTVTQVINQFTNVKDEAKIAATLNNILNEMNLRVLESIPLRQSFTRYQSMRIGTKTLSQLNISKDIRQQIQLTLEISGTDFSKLLELTLNQVSEKTKGAFASENDIKAAIICEFIMEFT
jgi:hypothetical protein